MFSCPHMVGSRDLRSGGRGGGRRPPHVPFVAEEGQDGYMEDITQEEKDRDDGMITPGVGVGGGVPPRNDTGDATGLETAAPLFDATGAVLVNAIPGIIATLQQLVQVQSGLLAERQTFVAPAPAPLFVPGAKQFRELGPAYFDGTGGPLVA